jgi:hypothetical protein
LATRAELVKMFSMRESPTVMRVATRCRSRDEFIAAFAPLVDRETIVVLTDKPRPIGSAQWFVIELADGTFVMRGQGEVVEWKPPPGGRLRLRLIKLDREGRQAHGEMLVRAAAVTRPPPRGTTRMFGLAPIPARRSSFVPEATPPPAMEPLATTRMEPLFPDEVGPIVPANPFGELQPVELEVFVDWTLSEENAAELLAVEDLAPPSSETPVRSIVAPREAEPAVVHAPAPVAGPTVAPRPGPWASLRPLGVPVAALVLLGVVARLLGG